MSCPVRDSLSAPNERAAVIGYLRVGGGRPISAPQFPIKYCQIGPDIVQSGRCEIPNE